MPDYNTILFQIREMIADMLGMTPDDVPVDAPFDRLGLASRDAVLLSGDLQDWLGIGLPATLLYEHPTPTRLAAFLADDGRNDATGSPVGERASSAIDPDRPMKGAPLTLDDFEEGRL